MATFSPPLRDNASQYRDIYNNPEQRFTNTSENDSAIQNPRLDNGSRPRTLSTRPTEDGRRKRTSQRRYQGRQESTGFVDAVSRRDQIIDQRYLTDSRQQNFQPANTNTAPAQKKKIHTSLVARARGITFGITTMTWLVPIYFFWQLPIAIVGSVMLGLSLQVETSYLLTAVDTAARVVGSLFGYEYVDLTAIGMLAVVSAAGFGVLSACVAGFTALLWGLHPLSGNSAGTKTATFIAGVVGACIPFANMFPWIIFWVLVMMRHPK